MAYQTCEHVSTFQMLPLQQIPGLDDSEEVGARDRVLSLPQCLRWRSPGARAARPDTPIALSRTTLSLPSTTRVEA